MITGQWSILVAHVRYLVEFVNVCVTYSLFHAIDSFLTSLLWLPKDSSIDHVKINLYFYMPVLEPGLWVTGHQVNDFRRVGSGHGSVTCCTGCWKVVENTTNGAGKVLESHLRCFVKNQTRSDHFQQNLVAVSSFFFLPTPMEGRLCLSFCLVSSVCISAPLVNLTWLWFWFQVDVPELESAWF